MLVLSRHVDESIVIGGIITVMVVSIQGDKVRLGVFAPREIPVHRQEVQDEVDREAGKPPRSSGPLRHDQHETPDPNPGA